ncbi:MAG: hypothetical protein IJZ81_03460 [Clostridia bacterium]|nr:hypothetical protein [Clostridia bacterium]
MKKRLVIILSVLCAVFVVGSASAPGTTQDPLVTKSYIDSMVIPATKFQIVNVPAGKTVIGTAGTEMILRMGECSIVGTQKGGVSDVTMGYDLADGVIVQGNHLLIVPLDDGRGVKTSTDCILMIKGGYEIR